MKRTFFLLFSIFFLFFQSVSCEDYSIEDILQEMKQMKSEIRFLKNKVSEQQQTIDTFQKQDTTLNELQREIRSLTDEVDVQRHSIDVLHEQVTPQDLPTALTLNPPFFNSGHSFFVKIGVTNEPFDNGEGWLLGGALDLKIADTWKGSLLGEIGLSFARSKERLDVVTSAVLGPLNDQQLRLNTLSIDIGFKYRFDQLGEQGSFLRRFQPYVRAGFAIQVFISDSDSIIAGQVPQAQELEDRNVPSGQGNIYTALNVGAGMDFMVTHALFIGLDYGHYELFAENGSSDALSFTTGVRF